MSAPDLTPTQSAEVERLMELVIDCESAAKEWLVAAPGFSAMKAADHKEARESLRTALSALVVRATEWEMLKNPEYLHANLLRGIPAQLTREQFLHLAGNDIGITKEQGS